MRRSALVAVTAMLFLSGCLPLHVTTPSGFGFRTWSDTGSSYDSVSQVVHPPACTDAFPSWRLRIPVEEIRRVEAEARALDVWKGGVVEALDCKRMEPDLGGGTEFFDRSRDVRLSWSRCVRPDPKYDALLKHVDRLLQGMHDRDRTTRYGCVFL